MPNASTKYNLSNNHAVEFIPLGRFQQSLLFMRFEKVCLSFHKKFHKSPKNFLFLATAQCYTNSQNGHNILSSASCLTWLVHVLGLGVRVCRVAKWSFVRV